MTRQIFTMLIAILFISCNSNKIEKKGVDASHLQQNGDLTYLNYEDRPYTGYWYAISNGRHVQGYFEDGKRDGVELYFHPNGKQWIERHYRAGVIHGLFSEWYSDGQLKERITYSNGVKVDK